MLKNQVNGFVAELRAYLSHPGVFNPWRDYDGTCDLCREAPEIRSKQMAQFLYSRMNGAAYLLVAEAIGYQGGRFTGVPLISERIILGNHGSINPCAILKNLPGRRTSNPDNRELNSAQKRLGFTEPTATIVWEEILKSKVSPHRVITWNIFPFHPYNPSKGPLTNRTPTAAELEAGSYYTQTLLKMWPNVTVVSIGKHAARTLNKLGIRNFSVPHPANGGSSNFKAAIKDVLVPG
ncbi:MAG: hypothetical protein BWY65_00211 [Firmicutes bacterium ADurb.Bin373]|nr:MAG: hypothetical protein BWY65_00211 [Firmicutes bacterium ADurb.Bin373]